MESVLQREPVNSETEAKNSSGLTVAMILLASVLAALVSRAGLGDTPAFKVPQYEIQSVWELPLILVLGAICGVTSVGFSYLSEVSYKATAFCIYVLRCFILSSEWQALPQSCSSEPSATFLAMLLQGDISPLQATNTRMLHDVILFPMLGS